MRRNIPDKKKTDKQAEECCNYFSVVAFFAELHLSLLTKPTKHLLLQPRAHSAGFMLRALCILDAA